jgi:uracil-DNA glycosylase
LDGVIGRRFRVARSGRRFDIVPLPHPSGASPWHRISPGRELLQQALTLIVRHPAFQRFRRNAKPRSQTRGGERP